MGSVGKLWALVAAELALLVTPMMWPTIPFEVGVAAYGLAVALLLVAGGSWLWELRQRKTAASAPTPAGVPPKLELVHRPGAPFVRQRLAGVGGRAQVGTTELLIGVRNVSVANVRGIRVQAAAATQAIPGLPLPLPPSDGPDVPFDLAPGEMRLVRFICKGRIDCVPAWRSKTVPVR